MGPRANVRTVEALKEMRVALVEFAERVGAALASADAEVSRVGQWVTHDRPQHWKREVRKREDLVTQARAEIARKRFVAAPNPASVVLEKKQLEKAERRLDSARRRADATRRWGGSWEREVLLARGPLFSLSEFVHGTIEEGVARLDRMIASLEAYLAVAAPASDLPETAQSLAGVPRTAPAHAPALLPDPEALRAIAATAILRARPPREPLGLTAWVAGVPSSQDAEALARLAGADSPPASVDTMVISARALAEPAVWFARLSPAQPGDPQGWYVGPLQGPDISGPCWQIPVSEFLESHPGLGGVLGRRPGSVVILVAGGVQAVFDPEGRNLWAPGV